MPGSAICIAACGKTGLWDLVRGRDAVGRDLEEVLEGDDRP